MLKQGYTADALARMSGCRLHGTAGEALIEELLTDSRKLNAPSQTLFFAITTARNDGHRYIDELYERGVRNFCVSVLPATLMPEAAYLLCDNTLKALQNLAAAHRRQFIFPVIGVTGSNGKTIVKEWLWQLLSPEKTIVRSPKSYNSQIGVPLSVWQMNALHNLAIIEAGISQPGEMENLQAIIRPTIGILTNIGHAHDEFFVSLRQKAEEKLKLFGKSQLLVYCSDHALINDAVKNAGFEHDQLLDWGRNSNARLLITDVVASRGGAIIRGIYQGKASSIEIPFADDASIENAIHCWAIMLWMGYGPDVTASRMSRLSRVAMRLEMKEGINGCLVINDAYSSDQDSLAIALDFMIQQNQHNQRTLILSDLMQVNTDETALYREIASLLNEKGVTRLIGIGPALSNQQQQFGMQKSFYANTDEFIAAFNPSQFGSESILIKGARIFSFERINRLLQQKSHETVLEVNLNALVHNLNFYRSALAPGTRVMAMVKAFSYGSGGFEIAGALQFHRVDYLAVAYADEGVELRKSGISLPIMVMNPEESGMEAILHYDLEPEIYSFRTLNMLEKAIKMHPQAGNQKVMVHIKLDTGMHRLGFEVHQTEELAQRLSGHSTIQVASVFSHLVASDDPSYDDFTRSQTGLFTRMTNVLQSRLDKRFMRHILNSAGIRRFPEAQFDMVRLGISLYGIASDASEQKMLETVTSLKTTVSQLRWVEKGDSVGYNRSWIATSPSLIATIPIGYADGLSRNLGNGKGIMMVNGKKVATAGNICMDMTMLDVTGVDVSEGDEVIVFGGEMPIQHLALAMGTIPYEILTSISRRVKRVYFQE